ncbi:adenosylcobinamide-GDP ribazoletransferase [Polymorphum gilvum]|uniref:Adenosylcobinamide-GDP ribazoletransferase n=1 Tax=Polymorphum gilvum (strain LMG 25793 / CGMCC 1.9160 / SL003B-26A1) TaxID=991905 RepID=F2J5Z7_POLGS|nr:adenosylcobinamide-GDP ribazoletransferase [Polymorphum gilvum]ADZ71251.1 Cobalamin synthase [Polymorphum gilvum SL003B-26A1]
MADGHNREHSRERQQPGLIADTAACIRFFSRLPLPRLSSADDPAAMPDFTVSARAMPLAGALIGLPAALVLLLLSLTALPALAAAGLAVVILVALTGALHEDGLADVADGFFGGTSRERRLEIMKDSRTGAFGALALALATLLKVALLAALAERLGPSGAALTLVSAEAASRALALWQWSALPAARPDGLAARFGRPGRKAATQGLLLAALCLVPAALAMPAPHLSLAVVLAALAAHGVGRLAVAKIGGATGDVLGAVQQISGLAFLAGLAMLP